METPHPPERPGRIAAPPPMTRFEPASFPPDAKAVYLRALDALDARGVQYLLGGAIGLNAYTGVWRDTKDLDVFLRARDLEQALAAVGDAGFEVDVVYPSWLAKAWEGDLFVDFIHRNANGLQPVDDEWFAHARRIPLLGRELPVVPLEELLLSKMFVASRNRWDGADVLHLLFRAGDRIGWTHLLERAGEHWEIVLSYLLLYRWTYPGFRDRIPEWVLDALLERLEADRRNPAPGSHAGLPFLGTLLDIVSFDVDVRAWGLPDAHDRILQEMGLGRSGEARTVRDAGRRNVKEGQSWPGRAGGR